MGSVMDRLWGSEVHPTSVLIHYRPDLVFWEVGIFLLLLCRAPLQPFFELDMLTSFWYNTYVTAKTTFSILNSTLCV
jgi:hypothetical protein